MQSFCRGKDLRLVGVFVDRNDFTPLFDKTMTTSVNGIAYHPYVCRAIYVTKNKNRKISNAHYPVQN